MARYCIHAVPQRMWYVSNFLVPSMVDQGIPLKDITIYNDEHKEGNLVSCLKAFLTCKGIPGGTWHIQDDVCISKNFKTLTEAVDFGLVCGFSSELYDGPDKPTGAVKREDMWFSFPCIRIPNDYAVSAAEWINDYIIGNPVYERYWRKGVNDDWAFRTWLKEFHPDVCAINLTPNPVDHVDYLLGGGTGKVKRTEQVRAQYWVDKDVVRELEDRIYGR